MIWEYFRKNCILCIYVIDYQSELPIFTKCNQIMSKYSGNFSLWIWILFKLKSRFSNIFVNFFNLNNSLVKSFRPPVLPQIENHYLRELFDFLTHLIFNENFSSESHGINLDFYTHFDFPNNSFSLFVS